MLFYLKKFILTAGLVFCIALWLLSLEAQAATDTIKTGVYAGELDLSGLTATQATYVIEQYVESLAQTQVTLLVTDDVEVHTTLAELGISWANPELVEEALNLGSTGNVIERYKVAMDLQYGGYVFDLVYDFDMNAIDSLVSGCSIYNTDAVNATLTRVNGAFVVEDGQTGYHLDVETSIDRVYEYLTQTWQGGNFTVVLKMDAQEPENSAEDFAMVTDVLGTFTTSYSTSGSARSANVANGCSFINGLVLMPGEEFSTLETITPFTEANGYYPAGSYLNGKVVDSLGGGICQVSTTLYNAVLLAELEVTERSNHSMIVTYVDPSADAAIAESSGKDFKFVNNTDYPIYIEGKTENKKITFTIYGHETRDTVNRKVTYESVVLETTYPESDTIYTDSSQAIGYIVTESAHIGYKAQLWKVVTENGVEVSREQVNSSTYKMSPRSATVGTATSDATAYATLMAAIETASIDHIKNVIAQLTTSAAENTVEVGEE